MMAVGTSGRWERTFAVIGLLITWRSIHTWRGRQGTAALGLAGARDALIGVRSLRALRDTCLIL